jgi:4-carboxymuconolactone decarboxylase
VTQPDGPAGGDSRYQAGMAVRRAVLGDAHVDRAVARTTGFSAPFQDLVNRTAWGEVWSRPGLDRRTRSCITLALLAALRCEAELAMHVRAAVRNGLTPADIAEVLLHTTVYAGFPAGNTAFDIAQRTLADLGLVPDPSTTDSVAGATTAERSHPGTPRSE